MSADNQQGFIKGVILIVIALLLAQYVLELDIIGWLEQLRSMVDL